MEDMAEQANAATEDECARGADMSGRGAETEWSVIHTHIMCVVEETRGSALPSWRWQIPTNNTNIMESRVPDDDVMLIFAENKKGQYYCIFIMQRIVLQVNLQ